MSANIGQAYTLFSKFDTDKNGLDRKELAKAALDNSIPTELKNFAATVAAGGKDNAGYMAEIAALNNDGENTGDKISFKDFVGLAEKSTTGDKLIFEALDFKTISEAKYIEGGVSVTNQQLRDIAGITTTPTDDLISKLMELLPLLLLGGLGGQRNYPVYTTQPPVNNNYGFNQLLSSIFGNLFQS